MALARARRRQYASNYWPGFVDMLSTLLLVVIFLMALFMVTNYIITQAASGKDTMLSRLNRQLSELTELLALERSKKESAEDNLAVLQATLLNTEAENKRLSGLLGTASGETESAEDRASALGTKLDEQRKITNDALAKVELLNQQLAALRLQLAALNEALEASEAKDKKNQAKIADLGQRLTWRSQRRSRSSPNTARTSSDSCARRSATVRTSRLSATVSCFPPTCFSIRAQPS